MLKWANIAWPSSLNKQPDMIRVWLFWETAHPSLDPVLTLPLILEKMLGWGRGRWAFPKSVIFALGPRTQGVSHQVPSWGIRDSGKWSRRWSKSLAGASPHSGSTTVCLWTGTKKGHFSIEGTFLYQIYCDLGVISVRSRRGAWGACSLLPLCLDQTEAWRAESKIFWDQGHPLSQCLDELFGQYRERRPPYRSLSVEERFRLLTGETNDSLYVGKLVVCNVTGFANRKPPRDVIDQAQPVRNDKIGQWQCPFCLQDTFLDISEVWTPPW